MLRDMLSLANPPVSGMSPFQLTARLAPVSFSSLPLFLFLPFEMSAVPTTNQKTKQTTETENYSSFDEYFAFFVCGFVELELKVIVQAFFARRCYCFAA